MRERVYCYELYHQLRQAKALEPLILMAELDKQGNPAFRTTKKPKPDFILHITGTNEHNSTILEVECKPGIAHLRKDMKTLKLMQTHGYKELVLLLYGMNTVPWRQINLAALEAGLSKKDFKVLLHRSPCEAAVLMQSAVETLT